MQVETRRNGLWFKSENSDNFYESILLKNLRRITCISIMFQLAFAYYGEPVIRPDLQLEHSIRQKQYKETKRVTNRKH